MDIAKALVAGDKGLLAMDESNPTCNKRFAALGIPQTEEARRAYREMMVTTPGLAECISGTARWIGLPVRQAQHFILSTASLSILGYEHNLAAESAIVLWNAVSRIAATTAAARL